MGFGSELILISGSAHIPSTLLLPIYGPNLLTMLSILKLVLCVAGWANLDSGPTAAPRA